MTIDNLLQSDSITPQDLCEHKIYTFTQRVAYKTKEAIKEKVELVTNPKKLYHEVIDLAKREGKPFAIYAAAVEITEDVIAPAILAATGHPEYIPLLWAIHTEPVMYPLYFAVRKLYRNHQEKQQPQLNKHTTHTNHGVLA